MCVALLHLLPESTEIFNEYLESLETTQGEQIAGHNHSEKHFPVSFVLAFCGYTVILMLEKIIFDSHTHQMVEENEEEEAVEDMDMDNIGKNSNINAGNKSDNDRKISSEKKLSTTSRQISMAPKTGGNVNSYLPNPYNTSFNAYYDNEMMSRFTQTIRSSRKGSISTISKVRRDKINNYLESFKLDTVEKKEEQFKNLFTTSGKISSMLLVNDTIRKRNSMVAQNNLQEELLATQKLKQNKPNDKSPVERPSKSEEEPATTAKETLTSYLLLLALSIHACFEGIAIGLQGNGSEIFYMFLAISFHKWVEALSIGINLNNSKIERAYLLKFIILFSLMTPLGICLGIFFSGFSELVEGVFLAISAGSYLFFNIIGSFIYISSSEIVIEEFSVSKFKNEKFLGFLTGAAIVCILTLFGHHH